MPYYIHSGNPWHGTLLVESLNEYAVSEVKLGTLRNTVGLVLNAWFNDCVFRFLPTLQIQ